MPASLLFVYISLLFCGLVFMRRDSLGVSEALLWHRHPEVQVGGGEKMKSVQRNPVTSSCHCSGVARSDSKISAKALYGKWLHGRSILLLACLQGFAFTCPSHVITPAPPSFLIIMAWDFTAHTLYFNRLYTVTYQGIVLWKLAQCSSLSFLKADNILYG